MEVLQSKLDYLSQGVVDAGCNVVKHGEVYPSKIAEHVLELEPAEATALQEKMDFVINFTSHEWLNLLHQQIDGIPAMDWMGISEQEIETAALLNPDGLPFTVYTGIDLCGGPINDINSDRATIVGFQSEIAEVFEAQFPEYSFRGFYDSFIPAVKEFAGKDNPKVFVLTYPNGTEAYEQPLSSFAKRHGFSIGDISQFDPHNVDIVIRQIKSQHMTGPDYKKLFEAAKEGLPIINSFGSYLPGHKGWGTILTALGLVPEGWFPKSYIVNPKLGLTLDSTGVISPVNTSIGIFKEQRKKYVFKPTFGAGGHEITIGALCKKYEWDDLWTAAQEGQTISVIEEYSPPTQLDSVTVGDWVNGEVVPSQKTLKLLMRIYGVNLNGQSQPITGEAFGVQYGKINASGYTMPIAFI